MSANENGIMGLGTTEAAKYLGVSLGTIRRWTDMGQIPCYRTPGGQRRWSIADLEAFAATLRRSA